MTHSKCGVHLISANEFHSLFFKAKEDLGITPEQDRESMDAALTGNCSKFNEITMRVIASITREIASKQSEFNCSLIRYKYDVFGKINRVEWGEKCEKCCGSGLCQLTVQIAIVNVLNVKVSNTKLEVK